MSGSNCWVSSSLPQTSIRIEFGRSSLSRAESIKRGRRCIRMAYISPPAYPDFLSQGGGKDTDEEEEEEEEEEDDADDPSKSSNSKQLTQSRRRPKVLITWALVSSLLMKEKLRLLGAVIGLALGTTCTLTMPLFSGIFSSCHGCKYFLCFRAVRLDR